MAGPGGGSRGGGGGRGGSFGGGSRGGSFGGGRPSGGSGSRPTGSPRPPVGGGFNRPPVQPRPPMGGGYRPAGHWGMSPRRSNGCGCLSGLMNMIFVPIILIIFVLFFVFTSSQNRLDTQISGSYDEEKFQDYANSQYEAEFGKSSAYEDNLLITVLIEDEAYYDFYYIAWVGDHIATDINFMLGSNETELGKAMSQCINATSYKYSLDSNLAQVMYQLKDEIQSLGLDSSFTCTESHSQVKSHLTNHSDLDMTEDTVNQALQDFTEATGIPVVIVVEDMDAVFSVSTTDTSKKNSSSMTFLVFVVLAAVVAIVIVKKNNKSQKWDGVPDNDTQENRYSSFDDQL